MFKNNGNHNKYLGQDGLVSIIITVIIASVISLIVVGFAGISRREQRQALDRQLSTQAFYTAESGINDVVKAYQDNPASISKNTTSCGATIGQLNALGMSSSLDSEQEYTCIFADPEPSQLTFSNVDTEDSTVVSLNSSSALISSITVSWENKDGLRDWDTSCSHPEMPTQSSWLCSVGIMRTDIVSDQAFTRGFLNGNMRTAFLYPSQSSTQPEVDYSGFGNQGHIQRVRCNGSGARYCSFTFTGLTPRTQYFLRLKSIYQDSAVTITANSSAGVALNLRGAQLMVDVTARANDVLKRVQAVVNISDYPSTSEDFPVHSSAAICKKFDVVDDDDSIDFHSPTSLCNLRDSAGL